MIRMARLLGYLSAFLGAWTLVRSPVGLAGGMVWLPKLWAGAWAPLLALIGGLAALLGWVRRDRQALGAGAAGALLAARYTVRVTTRHDAFAQAFGPDWEARIPPDLRPRLVRGRYRPLVGRPPICPVRRDLPLGTRRAAGEPLLGDLWQPPQGVPPTGLAIVYLHGSTWQAMDKGMLTGPLFRRLAGQGHLVLDVAYSLAPGADLDDMMDDVRQALAWMRVHAAAQGADPARIVLMGHSGGGHLALLAAYAPEAGGASPVRGVVSFYGVTDLTAFFLEYGRAEPRQPVHSGQIGDELHPRVHDATPLDRFLTRARIFPAYRYRNMPGGALLLVNLLGGTVHEVPEAYRWGSPLAHVGPHCPPTLQVFGSDDFAIPASHGRRLHRALQKAGVPSVYVELPEAVHGFDQYFGVSRRIAPAAQVATYDLERFLALMV